MTAKSDRIKQLLNDPLIQEAFENVRNKYRKAYESSTVDDGDALELRRMLFLLGTVEKDLQTSMEDGELEDFNAAEQERLHLGDLWNRIRK